MKKLTLSKEVIIVLTIKVCALALLWYCFFSTPTTHSLHAEQIANHITGENN